MTTWNITIRGTVSEPAAMVAPTVVADSASQLTVTKGADPDNGGVHISSYDLRHSPNAATWMIIPSVGESYSIAGLAADTVYYVQTRAVNGVGLGPWSPVAVASTLSEAGVWSITDNGDGTASATGPGFSSTMTVTDNNDGTAIAQNA